METKTHKQKANKKRKAQMKPYETKKIYKNITNLSIIFWAAISSGVLNLINDQNQCNI